MTAGTLFHSSSDSLQPVREGIRKRALVLSDNLLADEIFFDEGVATIAHAHDLEQAAYQVSGEFEVTLGDEHRSVGPGDAYQIPAGTPHAVRCLQRGSYLLITARCSAAADDHDHSQAHEHADD